MKIICSDKYDRRKLFYHPRNMAEILETGFTWPVTVNTGFTTYCNHSCVWCSTAYTTRVDPKSKGRDNLLIDSEVWLRNMEILSAKGTKSLIISGQGEPLLHPDANMMLSAVADFGLKYMLFSNGERLSEKYHESILSNCLAIRFSVDAATSEMHARWHGADYDGKKGKANFDLVVANIKALVNEKRARNLSSPAIGVQMICSELTESDFEEFARLFVDIGVDYIDYKSLQGNLANKNIVISSFDIHESRDDRIVKANQMIQRLKEIKSKFENTTTEIFIKDTQIESAYVNEVNGGINYNKCRAHSLMPMIEPDGNVYVCIDLGGDSSYVIGNIYDHNIDDIWLSKKHMEVVNNIDVERRCPSGCNLDETNMLLAQISNPDPKLHTELI